MMFARIKNSCGIYDDRPVVDMRVSERTQQYSSVRRHRKLYPCVLTDAAGWPPRWSRRCRRPLSLDCPLGLINRSVSFTRLDRGSLQQEKKNLYFF